jgi:ectoine hydroxylase-related dioxygenase (phytanoyl-CoA dioxygenase family)
MEKQRMKPRQQKSNKQQQKMKSALVNIPRIIVPRDSMDPNYVHSFTVYDTKEMLDFFNEFGFVVVRDVLTAQECTDTLTEVFDILENFDPQNCKWDRNDIRTWNQWPSNGMERFGSPSRPPIFSRQFLLNRINPNVHKVFATLLGEDDLVVNHDRCCLYRPTCNILTYNGIQERMDAWETCPNLHLDMSPWCYLSTEGHKICDRSLRKLRYENTGAFIFENNQVSGDDGLQLQGVINLVDNYEEDGGFQIVPGFHKIFDDYFTSIAEQMNPNPLKSILDPEDSTSLTAGYNFSKNDIINKYGVRIPLRAGSVIVWNQKMPHGSLPNFSSRMRSAQFIKMFPRTSLMEHKERAKRRRQVIKEQLSKIYPPIHLSQLAKGLLDLD